MMMEALEEYWRLKSKDPALTELVISSLGLDAWRPLRCLLLSDAAAPDGKLDGPPWRLRWSSPPS